MKGRGPKGSEGSHRDARMKESVVDGRDREMKGRERWGAISSSLSLSPAVVPLCTHLSPSIGLLWYCTLLASCLHPSQLTVTHIENCTVALSALTFIQQGPRQENFRRGVGDFGLPPVAQWIEGNGSLQPVKLNLILHVQNAQHVTGLLLKPLLKVCDDSPLLPLAAVSLPDPPFVLVFLLPAVQGDLVLVAESAGRVRGHEVAGGFGADGGQGAGGSGGGLAGQLAELPGATVWRGGHLVSLVEA
ncbi:hypothetical protein JZ751_025248 [Albula glossodonta]|uniref:Uncharacterized protein n=1 Tax=Albula glossodonta TaxID=121402 RepID=A0A8T2NIM0_9TELE|nr:hypothetical protein JZ751_025248 [Albula glossodonta]